MGMFEGLSGAILRVFRSDNLENALTKFGTERSRTAHTRIAGRRYMTVGQLDAIQQMGLVQRVNGELPRDASRPVSLTIPDAPEAAQATLDALDGLSCVSRFALAGKRSREYGGAALWVVLDGGGAPDEPIDYATVRGVKNLVLIDRFELSAYLPRGVGGASYYIDDPADPGYGTPYAYYYTPAQGGATESIHASRLLRFYGDDVPERIRLGWYDGWGAPVMEGVYNTFAQMWGATQSGGELIQEFGHMVYTLDNLAEIMTGTARDELSEWMALQSEARSTLRATILGKGQRADRAAMPLTGWSDVAAWLAQMFAAEVAMPMSKLYGQAPGGLSTDDGAAMDNWAARCINYQTEQLIPVYNQLLKILFAAQDGPTAGRTPTQWTLEIEPYKVPTQTEEATVTKTYADAVGSLVDRGIMSAEDAADTMRTMPKIVMSTDDTPAGIVADPALAGAQSAQDTALNGAQISSMLEIISAVWENRINYESGVAAMQRALPVDEETARKLIGARPTGPRTDAEDSFIPPQAVRDNAQRALDVRESKPESQRGMTAVGLARARDLSNGRSVSLDTLEKMVSYFARHEVDKGGETWDDQGKGWQAWMGWGGDEGWAWAKRILDRMERGDE